MQNVNNKNQHLSQESVNRKMSEGWLKMLEDQGSEPEINQLELARRSGGVPYRTVKRHIQAGFVEKNIEAIVADFRVIVGRYAPHPEILASQTGSLIEKHNIWFTIEATRHSVLLWEQLRKELHDPIITAWTVSNGRNNEALYALFWFCLRMLAEQWRLSGYNRDMKATVETQITRLYKACATGRFDTILGILSQQT